MKRGLSIAFFALSLSALAQDPSRVVDKKVHKIVMQVSAGDSTTQASALTQIGNIHEGWPNATIEVVCHSGGLDLLVAAKSRVANQVASLSAQGITFAACNNTMRRRNVKKEDLLPAAVVVPSGMIEVVMKQEEGWSYVKGGH